MLTNQLLLARVHPQLITDHVLYVHNVHMYLLLLSRLSVYVHKTADIAQRLYSRADNRKLSYSVADIASEYRYKE